MLLQGSCLAQVAYQAIRLVRVDDGGHLNLNPKVPNCYLGRYTSNMFGAQSKQMATVAFEPCVVTSGISSSVSRRRGV